MTRLAVAVLMRDPDSGLILAVSRKDDHGDFGLPGGKVEEYEALEEAIRREVMEETGYALGTLNPIFTRQGDVHQVTTFKATVWHKKCETEEAGRVAWVTPEKLMAGCFGEYNRRLFKQERIIE